MGSHIVHRGLSICAGAIRIGIEHHLESVEVRAWLAPGRDHRGGNECRTTC